MWRGISLADKCLLLFGAAVVLIIVAALTVPWLRMNSIVEEDQRDLSRRLVEWWQRDNADLVRASVAAGGVGIGRAGAASQTGGGAPEEAGESATDGVTSGEGTLRVIALPLPAAAAAGATPEAAEDTDAGPGAFGVAASAFFERRPERTEFFDAEWADWGGARIYRYALRLRSKDADGAPGETIGMITLERQSIGVLRSIAVNTMYLFSAGLIALGLALLVFYLITNKIILAPVRALKGTAELVREGNLSTRSQISTGDEFQDLSETFNQMLENLAASQNQLRAINASLDLKLNELAERNVALHEANRLKGEFLASVSHELRTPLHSVIGFSELLIEIADKEADAGDDSTRLIKRRRYLENIVTSSRSLLEMINGLLEMAKVEAGRIDLHVEDLNLADACAALLALVRPVAERQGVELTLELVGADGKGGGLPIIRTDTKKFQQVLFNLLSNAVKFTSGAGGGEGASGNGGRKKEQRVTLRAEVLPPRGPVETGQNGAGGAAVGAAGSTAAGLAGQAPRPRVRISVLDTGPGIPKEDQQRIFEKFQQLDTGHTRRHEGAGLGLAIARELTSLLQGEIQVESQVGVGSMFSVILPLELDPERVQETRLELAFRGSLR
jgi:signal transduction histidine kinase